ncbi:MAG: site-specific integrase [Gammaproteobacteria bacterium]|nr:site-specific integrase [Gammaproteobacteria bacterium]
MAIYIPKGRKVYYADFTFKGKHICRSTGTKNKTEAKQFESNLKRRLIAESLDTSTFEVHTLGEMPNMCWDWAWSKQKDGRRSLARALTVVTILGDIPLMELDEGAVMRMASMYRGPTFNRHLSALSSMLNRAKARGFIDTVPVLPWRKEQSGRVRVVTRAEEARVIELVGVLSPQTVDLVVVLVDTGMRLGEALRSSYRDVGKGLLTIWDTKTGVPRSIPLTNRVLEIYRRRGRFTLGERTFQRKWENARIHMGITDPNFVLHSLRHTCATRLLTAGMDIYRVMKWMGHSDISMTQRYEHMSPRVLEEGVGLLQDGIHRQTQWRQALTSG